MKIISKFHDYYDSANIYGVDPKSIYLRHTAEHEEHPSSLSFLPKLAYGRIFDEYELETFIVGFCGNFYAGALCKKSKNNRIESTLEPMTERIFYKEDEIIKFLVNKKGKSYLKSRYIKKGKSSTEKRLSELFNMNKGPFHEIFINLKTPVFLITGDGNDFGYEHDTEFIVNPSLKKLKFYKLFETYSAYQKLDMYISGVMPGKEKETAKVSDACKAEQKGFDSWSFRKHGSKSKKPKILKKNQCKCESDNGISTG